MLLSQIASEAGDHDKALNLANKAFVFYEARFGSDHAATAEMQGQLAATKLAAGDLPGALADAHAARAVLEDKFGQTRDLGGRCLRVEADALVGLEKPRQGRPLYERAGDRGGGTGRGLGARDGAQGSARRAALNAYDFEANAGRRRWVQPTSAVARGGIRFPRRERRS